ncbi:MAG TPA: LysR family transcriptional regulator [Myxococcaceae bacterium]|nr:LysR family transcriptional regulator [Myxococcaceae bacterium]
MFESVTLDQLRTLVRVAEEGSFSAAARKLHRVQSAVSTAMANLESQLSLQVWDRTSKVPKLTAQGQAVLSTARRVLGEAEGLRRLAEGMAGGLEPRVALCVDALFPINALVDLCLELVPVVGSKHPLAGRRERVPTAALAECVQLVLSERREVGVPDQAVLSPRTWRVADLHTKHALLRAGLGWGNMPEHRIRDDLRQGTLVALRPEAWGEDEHILYLSAVYRTDAPFGPVHRWVLARLEGLCARESR